MNPRRPWQHCTQLARYLWAAPVTLFGLLLALPLLLAGGRPRLAEGAIEVSAGRTRRLLQRAGIRAITLGHVVLGDDHASLAQLRTHEQEHIRQYERWGLFMVVLYPLESLYQWARGRHAYCDNRFERAAFAAERRAAVTRDRAGESAAD